MSEWQKTADQPEYNNRASRQFIIVEGWNEHSGAIWARAYWGIAAICRDDQPDHYMGYRRADVDRIMKEGGMDGVDRIAYWMPAHAPAPYPADVRA